MAERPTDAPVPPPASRLAEAFAALAATDGDDPAAVLAVLTERVVALSLAPACTAHLVDEADELQAVASCPDQRPVELLGQVQGTDGPSVEALQAASVRTIDDLEHHRTRWPSFAPEAELAGFRAAEAVPLHGPDGVIGVVTTLHVQPLLSADHGRSQLVRSMALVAASRLADQRALASARSEVEQLTRALESRVLIEQAKGMLAGTNGESPEDSFVLLRRYARDHNRVLSEVAEAVVNRTLDLSGLEPRG